ncbi:LLM class flavin-dependent oxidoreductase [Brevibacterium sp. UCMA 11754]|uniref:LLM class flavin-dependent oxidoreductase n=1 Tax=Brevibacterium sp. UCMA 11754 TaxID=2749198 RepID=UPI001F40D66E|nr:LLM class flavin-dependent oxidoreductase [Brevibacterium sp. UCMA 11754]MCF2573848.1 LLM class flavin-dependent oxidoreductase [Brevibacterium sp. UCMA 11754]
MSEGRYLWYIPNQARPGHRGDIVREDHNSLDTLTEQARAVERYGWDGALLGTGWARPDTFTVGAALAARTTRFQPLIAARPGYWHPANFAAATATLDHLSSGRTLINIVSGADSPGAYGDSVIDRPGRYERTREFLHVLRRLWTEESVTYSGKYYSLEDAKLGASTVTSGARRHPTLYFGGASIEAERVAAAEADVQLFWGETYDAISERITRLTSLSAEIGREHAPLEFGLRVTVVVRGTADEAWSVARQRVAAMQEEENAKAWREDHLHSVGQRRLVALGETADVLDDVLYTAPGQLGGQGAATTWLVGSYREVADALERYRTLGVSHFILSDTPYLQEVKSIGLNLLPLLK